MTLTLKCGCEALGIQQTEYLQADFRWQSFHLQLDHICGHSLVKQLPLHRN